MFVGRAPQEALNELYTSDLKAVVLENWDLFGTLFDNHKGRSEMNMDTVNRARRSEAHTKPITRDEADDFENSYAWLSVRLNRMPS